MENYNEYTKIFLNMMMAHMSKEEIDECKEKALDIISMINKDNNITLAGAVLTFGIGLQAFLEIAEEDGENE